jgi:hypothetical protein
MRKYLICIEENEYGSIVTIEATQSDNVFWEGRWEKEDAKAIAIAKSWSKNRAIIKAIKKADKSCDLQIRNQYARTKIERSGFPGAWRQGDHAISAVLCNKGGQVKEYLIRIMKYGDGIEVCAERLSLIDNRKSRGIGRSRFQSIAIRKAVREADRNYQGREHLWNNPPRAITAIEPDERTDEAKYLNVDSRNSK